MKTNYPASPTGLFALAVLLLALTSAAWADQLRNIKTGQALPSFEMNGLDGKVVKSADASGKVLVLVYLSAHQKQSEEVVASAHRVVTGGGDAEQLKLVFMSADLDQADYFRALRDRLMSHEPFALDEARGHYGRLGLIVFPTTVVGSKDGTLLHVLAGSTRDYEFQLNLYCRHALGQINETELAQRLEVRPQEKDDARARAERHRSVAAILRAKGVADGAIQELEQALVADPQDADAVVDLAEVLLAQGKTDDAERRVKELLAKQPDCRGANLVLGVIKLKRNQLDEAEKLLKESLALNPDPVRVNYYLGQVYERKGDYKQAMERYRDALKRSLKEP
jgi:tetratricopeptide (TPR) repeat protein